MKIFNYCVKTMMLSALIFSCNREYMPEPSSNESIAHNSARVSGDVAKYDPVIENSARVLAKSLNNFQVRELIKTEASKKFDGDFDILASSLVNVSINGRSMRETMSAADNQNPLESYNIEKAVSVIPLLNISVPIGIHKWNTESFIPLVVAFPDIADESKLEKVKAFDSKGNMLWIDAKNLSDDPIIVVSINERMVVDGKGRVVKRKNMIAANRADGDVGTYLLDPGDGGGGGSGGGGGGGGGTTTCRYTDGQYLYAKWFFSDQVQRWESELKGLPEITMRVYAPSSATNFSSLGEIRRVDEMEEPATRNNGTFQWNNDEWYGSLTSAANGTSIVAWSNAIFSKTLLFHFAEIDGGDSKVPVTIGASFKVKVGDNELTNSLSVTFDIANNDENIGQLVVDQCNNPPQPPHPLSNGQPYYDVNGTAFGVVLGN